VKTQEKICGWFPCVTALSCPIRPESLQRLKRRIRLEPLSLSLPHTGE
jgi:hypothetical protein